MNSPSTLIHAPEIVLAGSLSQVSQDIIHLSKAYETVILLFEDDFSNHILASWAELDRLNLKTRKIGEVLSGIEVHTFGMDDFPHGTRIELHLRETSRNVARQDVQKAMYKSILNELSLITVRVTTQQDGRSSWHPQ